MSPPIGKLKTAGTVIGGKLGPGEEREVSVRTARKDGKQVVSLRATERENDCIVLCEVYPVSGLAVDPLTPGPYVFVSTQEASRFIEEALQALVYLGCEVT